MASSDSNLIDLAVWRRVEYHARARRVAHFLRDHIGRHITLAEVAQVACMERTAFSRYFHQRVGMRFSSFLRAYRVGVAIEEMGREDLSLTEVAGRAGFGCLASLERAFKSRTGESPSRFRQRLLAMRDISTH
jgi:AraC-like DNA-binding protein